MTRFANTGFAGNFAGKRQKSAIPWPIRKTSAIPIFLLLAACGQPTPLILTPPPALLTCKPAPDVPETLPPQGTVERDRVTVELWLAEREAGADCRANLAGVKKWADEAGK
jgi:hypothetical protein